MAKKQTSTGPLSATYLRIPRSAAREKLVSRIEIGRGLIGREVHSNSALEELIRQYHTWTEYNTELLGTVFTTDKYANEYSYIGAYFAGGYDTLAEQISDCRNDIDQKVRRLESIVERLDLIEEAPRVTVAAGKPRLSRPTPQATGKVFIVHGRDEQMRDAVARLLERLELDAVILSEQPNAGRTIIEKFEQESDVGFAVILLSPDDMGALKGEEASLQERARQNVILELGYFVGHLGRERVCALKKGNLELPSDIVGVAYTPFGPDEGWKLKLAQELRAAGHEVDLNRL